ncbi:hypothetical protein [Caballeronia mineralivorans]|jgi:hypothetical protein|uniref:hypothetical protein n=1 Tax=Caballeronia mineralivorans TaxID=2010198 RepID=UPI0023F5379B|nr:hypothetical protein [Caballeronia mineralivorans]MDB5789799.1 hypothetical protein [Caballeronia mineralivorans]MEA3097209.1 hypothetical protein [Caballeronia mineralivorans]
MTQMKVAAIAAALLLAGCNSAMPPDGSRAVSAARAAATPGDLGLQSPGTAEAIETLALPPARPLTPNPAYARFPRYVGTLGDKQIEMKLGAKTDERTGVHGEYRFAGASTVILVAGDRDGDTLEIEESNDGTHITGNWVGKFAADGSVSGERMNADDSNPVPFDLKPVGSGLGAAPAAGTAAPKTPQPAAPSLEPAPPPAPPVPGNALGGTSNVIIGE